MTRAMTRDEALEYLENLPNYFVLHRMPKKQLDRFQQVLAALSSPCAYEGREPLAKGYADPDTLADYNAGRIHMMTLFKVQGLHTEMPVIILPADEPQKGESWRCSGCGATNRRGCICFGDV